jgi:hypothetical protein
MQAGQSCYWREKFLQPEESLGQTAVCGAVTAFGGIAGILCQIGNEINLYTNLHNCRLSYEACAVTEISDT